MVGKSNETIEFKMLKIPVGFLDSRPSVEKIAHKRVKYKKNPGSVYITISRDDVLFDGYISLLILLENGIEELPCVRGERGRGAMHWSYLGDIEDLLAVKSGAKRAEDICGVTVQPRGVSEGPSLFRLWHKQNGNCYICGCRITLDSKRDTKAAPATIDHLMPLSLGGSDTYDNYALCCQRCNQLKGSFVFSEDLRRVIIRQKRIEESIRRKVTARS